ncbi:uncharacterized protein LOC117790292 [Drosophila innubila]|uniref:uncharacterized protein LOC117790292 n=1 Tax=Drosophila innubila TaxID=198719 RepID=UPI00148E8D26|nr:uncharacterized protein LOC117790292 [Drosophila innubila]
MSMSNLSVDGEFRYIIQWFNEWSELQRDDFVYVFVEYLTRDASVGAGEGGSGNGSGGSTYVNGVVNSLATSGVQDKPMSLFQCRIKLFREWNPKWPADFKSKLQEQINEIDPKVGEKIINELKTPHSMHNGDVSVHLNVNGTSGNIDCELEQSTDVSVTIETTQATTTPAAVNDVSEQTLETDNDSHLAAVLRQETPVDDDDDQLANNDGNTDTNGIYASSAAVTTIAVNASPTQQQPQSESPSQSESESQPIAVEPVEQVENHVSASVIVSVAASAAAAAPEVVPVA